VGGPDVLATLSPSDYALAEYSNITDAGVYYAVDSFVTTTQVINQLRAIIQQIDAQPNGSYVVKNDALHGYASLSIISP